MVPVSKVLLPAPIIGRTFVIAEDGKEWLDDVLKAAASLAPNVAIIMQSADRARVDTGLNQLGLTRNEVQLAAASSDKDISRLSQRPPRHLVILPLKWDNKVKGRLRDLINLTRPEGLWCAAFPADEARCRRLFRIPCEKPVAATGPSMSAPRPEL